jgi:hypothetical protein
MEFANTNVCLLIIDLVAGWGRKNNASTFKSKFFSSGHVLLWSGVVFAFTVLTLLVYGC